MSGTRLIAIDIDGTLLHSDGHVSERNLAAIRKAEAHGIEIAIATGRRHSYAMRVLRELDRPAQAALISSNGTVIRTLGSELLYREHMPLETARWVCEHVKDFRGTLVLTFDKVRADGEDDARQRGRQVPHEPVAGKPGRNGGGTCLTTTPRTPGSILRPHAGASLNAGRRKAGRPRVRSRATRRTGSR